MKCYYPIFNVWPLINKFVYYSIIKNKNVMKNQVEELELMFIKLERLELQLVENDVIEDGDMISEALGELKERLYDKIREVSNE